MQTDIVHVDKLKGSCFIIYIAFPSDRNVDVKQEENINKCMDWKLKQVNMIPIVTGAFVCVI